MKPEEKQKILAAAEMGLEVDSYGAMHIVVEDWNVDDANIHWCLEQTDATEVDKAYGALLLSMPGIHREISLMKMQELYASDLSPIPKP